LFKHFFAIRLFLKAGDRLGISLEAFSKKSFGPISLLALGSNPRNTRVCLRFEPRGRLDIEPKSVF
jgi:hypothetical protein